MSIRTIDDVLITKIITNARPGAEIADCFDSLIVIALKFECEAILIHNAQEYSVTAEDLRNIVVKCE